jgi:Cdc6-like AAA superfamily ATPase
MPVIQDDSMSVGERICSDFKKYIIDLVDEKRCFFLPYNITGIKFRNIGLFDNFKAVFKDFNVVYGSCGRGKTTLTRSIAHVFDLYEYPKEQLLKKGSSNGDIIVDVVKKSSFNLRVDENIFDYVNVNGDCARVHEQKYENCVNNDSVRCIMLDDTGERLSRPQYEMFLRYLRELNADLQIIVTTSSSADKPRAMFSNLIPGCTFIDLDRVNSQERLF